MPRGESINSKRAHLPVKLAQHKCDRTQVFVHGQRVIPILDGHMDTARSLVKSYDDWQGYQEDGPTHAQIVPITDLSEHGVNACYGILRYNPREDNPHDRLISLWLDLYTLTDEYEEPTQ